MDSASKRFTWKRRLLVVGAVLLPLQVLIGVARAELGFPELKPGSLILPLKDQSLAELAQATARICGVEWLDRGTPQKPLPPPNRPALYVASSLMRRRCQCKVASSSSTDLLRGLALAAGATWSHSGQTWLLTDQPDLTRLTLLGPRELETEWTTVDRTFTNFDGKERLLLRRFLTLAPLDLSLSRRRALSDWIRIRYATEGQGMAPESLQLRGVSYYLRPHRGPGPAAAWDIVLRVAETDGGPFDCAGIGIPDPGLPPLPDHWEKPSLPRLDVPTGAPPRLAPSGEQLSVDRDPRFAVRARFAAGTLGTAVTELARVLPLDILVSTQRARAPLRVASPNPTAADLCSAIAEATGGRWLLINKLLVLQPDPGIERIAELAPEPRDYWLQSAAAQITSTLDPGQLKTLRKEGELKPEELAPQQLGWLKWLVRVAFVQNPAIRPGAVSLKDVHVRLAGDEKQKWVAFEMPRIDLPPINVRAIPLK